MSLPNTYFSLVDLVPKLGVERIPPAELVPKLGVERIPPVELIPLC